MSTEKPQDEFRYQEPKPPFDWDVHFQRMQDDTSTLIHDLVVKSMQLEHQALEEMVERMLVSPIRVGIAVVLDNSFDTAMDDAMQGREHKVYSYRHYRLDEHVPFGHIYEFPSMASYELWQERGCPS
ncbi:hypothetical protein SEA_FREGLEY_14 [Microbacterium phage Fregley]|nr:hypothetical protein SEA_FREGLEY_14 [Microbacterium phage Fregley]WNT44225.1 hypothetical protein SEA_CANDC_12 [Microbacterium phage CandC]